MDENLANYLRVDGEDIYLPIEGYIFILSRGAAENMIEALRGALARLTPAAADDHEAEPIWDSSAEHDWGYGGA
jgi:hypothetical protein